MPLLETIERLARDKRQESDQRQTRGEQDRDKQEESKIQARNKQEPREGLARDQRNQLTSFCRMINAVSYK